MVQRFAARRSSYSSPIVSRRPTVSFSAKGTTYKCHLQTGRVFQVNLKGFMGKRVSVTKPTLSLLSKLTAKLSELSISFHFIKVSMEQDAEIPNWWYSFVVIGIEWPGRQPVFKPLSDYLLNYAYSFLTPKDAVKVLVVLERV